MSTNDGDFSDQWYFKDIHVVMSFNFVMLEEILTISL